MLRELPPNTFSSTCRPLLTTAPNASTFHILNFYHSICLAFTSYTSSSFHMPTSHSIRLKKYLPTTSPRRSFRLPMLPIYRSLSLPTHHSLSLPTARCLYPLLTSSRSASLPTAPIPSHCSLPCLLPQFSIHHRSRCQPTACSSFIHQL